MKYYSPEEIKKYKPFPLMTPNETEGAFHRAKDRMVQAGVWQDNQMLGRRYAIGCIALEITQRCNLDCTLCYLSEHSESVKDIPMEEIYRRIDQIRNSYGPGTDVQVTGGDPTLRNRGELVEIFRRIKELGMRPTLMTNGLKATRDLLEELVEVGLLDVAFHVDLTQERNPFKSEAELNKVRNIYIERCRGLPIHVIFNTTVHAGNFHEIPELIKFFRQNADVVGFASFQIQADTGRGVLRQREQMITMETTWAQIQKGAEIDLAFDAIMVGHHDCNRWTSSIAINGNLHSFVDNPEFVTDFLNKTTEIEFKRTKPIETVASVLSWAFKHPDILTRGLKHLVPRLWKMKGDLLAAKGKAHKLTFFVHNFMDANGLQCDRIDSCSFMVMTAEGPVSMCMHNAKRDAFILKPLEIGGGNDKKIWNPLTGEKAEVVHG